MPYSFATIRRFYQKQYVKGFTTFQTEALHLRRNRSASFACWQAKPALHVSRLKQKAQIDVSNPMPTMPAKM